MDKNCDHLTVVFVSHKHADVNKFPFAFVI